MNYTTQKIDMLSIISVGNGISVFWRKLPNLHSYWGSAIPVIMYEMHQFSSFMFQGDLGEKW